MSKLRKSNPVAEKSYLLLCTSDKGFSLLELLVVIAVMGVMMGLIGFSFLSGGSSQIGAGQRDLMAMIHQARTLAMASGREARLIVSADNGGNEEGNFLRYAEVILEQDSNDSEIWSVEGVGLRLPEGVWFVAEEEVGDEWPKDGTCIWSSSSLDEPFLLGEAKNGERSEQGGGARFHHLAFDPTGAIVSDAYPAMPRLVIGKANLIRDSDGFRPFFSNPLDIAGVQIQPFGGIIALEAQDFTHAN